jgi:hypothetical protein
MNRKFSSRIAVIDLVTGRTAVQSLPESQLTVTLASCRPKYHPGDTLILSDQFHGMRKRKLYNLGDNFFGLQAASSSSVSVKEESIRRFKRLTDKDLMFFPCLTGTFQAQLVLTRTSFCFLETTRSIT